MIYCMESQLPIDAVYLGWAYESSTNDLLKERISSAEKYNLKVYCVRTSTYRIITTQIDRDYLCEYYRGAYPA